VVLFLRMEVKASMTGARGWVVPSLAALAWLTAGTYLGGGIALVQLLLLLGGVMLPATALVADALKRTGLDDEMRACAAAVIALLSAVPAFYGRRFLPIPHLVFDVVVAGALLGFSIYSGALGRLFHIAATPVFRAAGWLLTLVVPLVFCLIWMGFEVRGGGVVRYYGLFPIDFSNLSNVITMMKASPGLPLFATAGSGPFFYHWWYYALPAWLTDFAGLHSRNTAALILCNLLVASLLVAGLCATIWRQLADRVDLSARARLQATIVSAGIVTVAPFSLYAYQFVVGHLHQPFFTLGQRNSLLLSPLNSMTTFGNNTLALVAVVTIAAAVDVWNQRPSYRLAVLMSFLSVAVAGLNVTIAFPLALALGTWLTLAAVKRGRFLAVAIPIGLLGLVALRLTHVLGGSRDPVVIAFDRGQFLQNAAFAMAPLWVLALAAVRAGAAQNAGRRPTFHLLLIGAGILVPSFIAVGGVRADPSVMSMKIASMIVVAAAPLVAAGVVALATKRVPVRRTAAALAVAVGLTNALMYTGQFAVYRAFNRGRDRMVALPAAYVDALDYVRLGTPPMSLVVDPSSSSMKVTISTLLIGERRVWLPTSFGTDIAGVDAENPRIRSRAEIWRAWEGGGFRDESIASAIAQEADVIVGPPTITSSSWRKVRGLGDYAVYAAARALGRRSAE
jgi:hypothetical protein